jgi:phosphoglycerol transferase MdoB-like AlkP superfamily enzyme
MFEGKNLILFLGEAFDQISVQEEFTPTLYKMATEGFYFKNHFAPMYSCATGESEFISLTSLVPVENVCTPNSYSENYYPFSLPALFNKEGYYSSSYHNYYDKYYDRDILHPNLGFDQYLNRTGLDMEKLVKGWPSDEVMMQNSVQYWLDKEQFFSFYITVSGHFPYYDDGTIILENWNVVKDWDADYLIQKYVATQVELDRSIKYLMDELEAAGKLDDTVFAIYPDHFPFKISPELLNEYSTVSVRTEDMNENNVPMIIWSPGMDGEVIEKYTDTFDILPTLANLFNLDYDARYYFGEDAFNESEGLVIFRSSSWITDLGYYNATKNEFKPYTDVEVSKEYIEYYNELVRQYFDISYATLQTDYYKNREE